MYNLIMEAYIELRKSQSSSFSIECITSTVGYSLSYSDVNKLSIANTKDHLEKELNILLRIAKQKSKSTLS